MKAATEAVVTEPRMMTKHELWRAVSDWHQSPGPSEAIWLEVIRRKMLNRKRYIPVAHISSLESTVNRLLRKPRADKETVDEAKRVKGRLRARAK